jgi:crotonobetainyl-CoA:carnitine CoA-transferase CaiB-like acyl-CoA transferase
MIATSKYRAHVSDRAAPRAAASHRRRLACFISDEPRRPRPADIEKMVATLPYGMWVCGDQRIVIFNRNYSPIWQKLPNGEIRRADETEWISFVEQKWFDFTDARYEKSARERLRQILREFFAGKDLKPFTIWTEWDNDDEPMQGGAQ